MPGLSFRKIAGITLAAISLLMGSRAMAGGTLRRPGRVLYRVASTTSAPATYGRFDRREILENRDSRPGALLAIGPSLGIVDGSVGFGASAQVLFRLARGSGFFLGFEAGLLRWSGSGSAGDLSTSASISVIPLLLSSRHRFEGIGASVLPYVGLGLGAGLAIGSVTVSGGDSSLSGSGSTAVFMGSLQPGIEFVLYRGTSLYVEPKVGLLKSTFLFAPSLGLSVAL